jgi:hypothetical protein
MTIEIISVDHRKPGDFPLLAELKPGNKLVADGGFTCLREGEVVTVEQDADGLFVRCCAHDDGDYGKPVSDARDEKHYLDGQAGDNDECVGLFREPVDGLIEAARICANAGEIGVAVPVGLLTEALGRFAKPSTAATL